jgi:tetratricopeptide (TPR) repeat protein
MFFGQGDTIMKTLISTAAALAILSCGANSFAQYHDPRALEADPLTATAPIAPTLSGLGEHSLPVTTTSGSSQRFFDQGLRLAYAFNHSEALRSFKEAARLDPENAMAWWGQALVLGPNINLPMMPYVVEQAWSSIRRAVALKDKVTVKEAELIEALALRYAASPDDRQAERNRAWADAMLLLADRYPDDPDVATLTASALMNLSPWNYWHNDGTPYARTTRVLDMLSRVTELHPTHTGALHYYIHITEAQRPELGEEAADRLNGIAPGAGHLLHMPSHIYMRVGRYADAFDVNRAASRADEAYVAACNAQGLYPVGYYPHNVHFLVWSAQSMGRYADAMAAARQVESKIPDFIGEIGNESPTGRHADAWQLFEVFLAQPMYTMVRFGDWQAVLNEPQPPEAARLLTGVWHYARGLARVNTGNAKKARHELNELRALLDNDAFAAYPASLNGAASLVTVASAVLEGEIQAASGDYDAAIASLATAARLQDSLMYMEPPDWFMPSRHYLGAVLLEAGRASEAETVYWDDLKKNPDNGYSLFGVVQAQAAQGKDNSAVLERFRAAWAHADHELTSSRY